jgi:hypothetical protein
MPIHIDASLSPGRDALIRASASIAIARVTTANNRYLRTFSRHLHITLAPPIPDPALVPMATLPTSVPVSLPFDRRARPRRALSMAIADAGG